MPTRVIKRQNAAALVFTKQYRTLIKLPETNFDGNLTLTFSPPPVNGAVVHLCIRASNVVGAMVLGQQNGIDKIVPRGTKGHELMTIIVFHVEQKQPSVEKLEGAEDEDEVTRNRQCQ